MKRVLPYLIPLALLILGAVVVWTAPLERTLGANIRTIYIHVAFSRAGGTGLMIAGALGLILLIWPNPALDRWARAAGIAGFTLFMIGLGVTLIAQLQNWNGIHWREPRMIAAMNGAAAGVIVMVLLNWFKAPRITGGLFLLLAILVVGTQMSANAVLHPGNAITESASPGIRHTGTYMLVLGSALWAWLAWWVWGRQQQAVME